MIKTLVFFHKNCFDGTLAAAVFIHHLKYNLVPLSQFEFVAWDYKEEVTDFSKFVDCHVMLLDLTFREEALEEVAKVAKSVTIIDHHPRAHRQAEKYSGEHVLENVTFFTDPKDNPRSAARLVFSIYFPKRIEPDIVRWIGLGDLFKFDEPEVRPMRFGAATLGYDPFVWEETFLQKFENVRILMNEGKVLAKAADAQMDYLMHNCLTRLVIDGHSVVACNAPRFLVSELAKRLYEIIPVEESPFIAIFFEEGGQQVYSLRRGENGTVDLGELAAKFGGDGHAKAAGFSVTVHKCPLTPRLLPEPQQQGRLSLPGMLKKRFGWSKDPNLM